MWTSCQAETENCGTAVIRIYVINSANVPVRMLGHEMLEIPVASNYPSNVSS